MITKVKDFVKREPVVAANLLGGLLVVLLAIGHSFGVSFLENYDTEDALGWAIAIVAWLAGEAWFVRQRVSPVNNS